MIFITNFYETSCLACDHKLYDIDNFIFINIFIAYKVLNIISFVFLIIVFLLLQKPSEEWRGKHFKMPTKMKTRFNMFLSGEGRKSVSPAS